MKIAFYIIILYSFLLINSRALQFNNKNMKTIEMIREETKTSNTMNIDSATRFEAGIKVKFQCDECQKLYSSKQCLKEHKYSHTNEKPYICKTCKKRFRHASQFTLHKKSHLTRSSIAWVKLTDLMQNFKIPQYYPIEFLEQIQLPPITQPQQSNLPTVNELTSILFRQ